MRADDTVIPSMANKRIYLPIGWLVVWNMFYDFPYIGNFIIPTDELHHFSEGLVYHQPVGYFKQAPNDSVGFLENVIFSCGSMLGIGSQQVTRVTSCGTHKNGDE